jgi:hypothetical protein
VHSFRGVIIVILFYILINNIYSIIALLAIIVLHSLARNAVSGEEGGPSG